MEEAGENGGNAVESTTAAGAATFDDFRFYFVVALWMVYLMPIVVKFFNTKQSNWQKKLKWAWNCLKGQESVNKIQ